MGWLKRKRGDSTVNELEFNFIPILGLTLFLYMTYVTYCILFDKGNGKTVFTFYYLGILATLIIVDVDTPNADAISDVL